MTITLAICPLYAGYCGIAIADGPTVLYAQSHEVGTLSPSDAIPGRTMVRTVDHSHLFSLVDLVRSLCGTYGVTEALIERAADPRPRDVANGGGVTAHRSQWLADACEAAMAGECIPCRVVHASWRARGSVAQIAAAVSEAYGETWPASGAYTVVRSAGALILHAAGVKLPVAQKSVRGNASKVANPNGSEEVTDAPRPDLNPASVPTTVGETDTQPGRGGPFTPPAPIIPPRGRADRVAAVDAGSAHVGVCIVEGTTWPVRHLFSRTYPVGESVLRNRPKVVTRKDGTSYTLTHRHSLRPEHLAILTPQVMAELARYDVSRLVIENVDSAWISNLGAAANLLKEVAGAQAVLGDIGGNARNAGIRVEWVSSTSWRAVVVPRKKDGPGSAGRVQAAVAEKIADWPGGDDHAADAGGICLWALALPEPGKTVRVRTARTPEAKRARGRRKTAEAREAAGCTCVGREGKRGRHPKTSPVAVATRAARWDRMMKGEVRV